MKRTVALIVALAALLALSGSAAANWTSDPDHTVYAQPGGLTYAGVRNCTFDMNYGAATIYGSHFVVATGEVTIEAIDPGGIAEDCWITSKVLYACSGPVYVCTWDTDYGAPKHLGDGASTVTKTTPNNVLGGVFLIGGEFVAPNGARTTWIRQVWVLDPDYFQ